MPIKYNYEVSVNDNKAKLNKDIFLFRGNRNIHYYFSIKGARFTFSKENEDLLESYSPLPPYEVLQTREITVDELQTAHYLSRLLDGFYNTPTWRSITRILILENPHFIHELLDHLVQTDVIDTPLSLEKRGLILYDFCKNHYPDYLTQVSIAWIEAGMSLKKAPAEKVRTKRQLPPESWEIEYGAYRENLRLCFLPTDEEEHGYWFGFESEIQKIQPVFKAKKLS